MKLPDLPEYAIGPTIDGVRYKPPSLSTTQLQAIQREAAIWALDEAAKAINPPRFANEADRIIAWDCVNAILALKGEIE